MTKLPARFALALAVAGSLALGGCSYRPLYGTTDESRGVAATLSGIAIPEATTRVGQLIRNDLISGMQPNGEDRYTLTLTPEVKTTGIIAKAQPATTRRSVTLTVSYALVDRGSGATVHSGKTFSQASFDLVRQPLADTQAETDATERAAHEVSADIRTRLAAFVASRQ